jgi:transcriptional regulator with XRE-family HTH domain
MAYYQRIRDLREDHDLTQNQVVEILQMHKTTYTNYEQGKREPPFEFMIRLALFYDVTLDYLAGLTNVPRPLEKKKTRNRQC